MPAPQPCPFRLNLGGATLAGLVLSARMRGGPWSDHLPEIKVRIVKVEVGRLKRAWHRIAAHLKITDMGAAGGPTELPTLTGPGSRINLAFDGRAPVAQLVIENFKPRRLRRIAEFDLRVWDLSLPEPGPAVRVVTGHTLEISCPLAA